jgi:hypothetical protein
MSDASQSALTPHTAPRTIEGLQMQTPFKLRLLVQSMQGFETAEQKMAWHNCSTPETRASYVLAMLHQWDKANPGLAVPANGAGAAVAQTVTPVQPVAPGTVAPGPAAVSPQALQAAAAATAEAPKGRRTPRTPTDTSAAAAPADLGADVINLLHNILNTAQANGEKIAALEKKVDLVLAAASSGEDARATWTKALQDLSNGAQNSQQLQVWTLMSFLTFMQESMGASIPEILGAAMQDSASFQQIVTQATGGKG